jgi:segregation and condensation protein B
VSVPETEITQTVAVLPAPGAEAGSPPGETPAPQVTGPSQAELPALVESLLFVASSPIPVGRLAQVLGVAEESVETALTQLTEGYVNGDRGLRLLRKGDRVHLTTAPQAAPHIERFLGLDLSAKLSQAALETLAVIAYRQPLTRAEVEAIRGVGCDGVLRTLITRELVEPVGRLEQPGRPYQYGTTIQFLQYFGLESLNRLPPLPESTVPLPRAAPLLPEAGPLVG